MRVTMIHAPDPIYAATQTYGATFVPLWAYTLSAYIRDDKRIELKLYDNRFDADIGEADVYLYSGINQDLGLLQSIRLTLCERYSAKHVIGGPICSSFDAAGSLAQLDGFDHICIGDGEVIIKGLLEALATGNKLSRIIRAPHRFNLMKARSFDAEIGHDLSRYYGGVVEVSRGCPFLCEFCDIRTLPDNNRTHLKPSSVIIEELEFFCRRGINQILLACDNLIGDLRGAEELVDSIIEWKQRTGFHPGLYTWLTINLFKTPHLMEKMRAAGFDLLFIGVESFEQNSLLETAKVQNVTAGVVEPLRIIQSYGFIVVAGLIFGFDSDTSASFDVTLRGLEDAALLSGDPSLLVALPGTPLYRRMKLSGRLRESNSSLGGYKYHTNIRYLQPKQDIIRGFRHFAAEFVKGKYQYRRLRAYFDLLESGNFIALKRSGGFGNLASYFRVLLADRQARRQMITRLSMFLLHPGFVWYALRGLLFVIRHREVPGGMNYFRFWFFAWTNTLLKYSTLRDEDFDIESVGPNFDIRDILPERYATTANEPIPRGKINAQLRNTTMQLGRLIETRLKTNPEHVH